MNKELLAYINNPKSSKACFDLGEWYYKQSQWAGALTYYLKVTEIDDNKELTYYSLLKGGRALHRQDRQTYQAKGMYLQAISVMPERSEGYYWLSKTHVELREWNEGLTMACIGYECEDSKDIDLEYDGKYGFLITKANCYKEIGRFDEAIEIYTNLLFGNEIDERNRIWCSDMMNWLWGTNWTKHLHYKKGMELNHHFKGWENIKRNYSQAFQDLFVLTLLNGKRDGTYVEIGACEPKDNSNTYLLENDFGWKGISFEIDSNLVNKFNGIRENKCIIGDATIKDYKKIFSDLGYSKVIDYLQLDIEPAKNTFDAMLAIPFEDYKFRIITYEHDWYCDDKSYKEKSRKYLEFLGYELVISDVCFGNDKNSFEDWWVKPELVDENIIKKLKSINKFNKIDEIFIKINND